MADGMHLSVFVFHLEFTLWDGSNCCLAGCASVQLFQCLRGGACLVLFFPTPARSSAHSLVCFGSLHCGGLSFMQRSSAHGLLSCTTLALWTLGGIQPTVVLQLCICECCCVPEQVVSQCGSLVSSLDAKKQKKNTLPENPTTEIF